jgi:hypothetical protein
VNLAREADTKHQASKWNMSSEASSRATTGGIENQQVSASRPILVRKGVITMFPNGTSLLPYQSTDLQRLLARDRGEIVCGDLSDVGYILTYDMGQVIFSLVLYAVIKSQV